MSGKCDTCAHLNRFDQPESYYRCDAPITYPANVMLGSCVAPDHTVSRWITRKIVDEKPEMMKACPLYAPA